MRHMREIAAISLRRVSTNRKKHAYIENISHHVKFGFRINCSPCPGNAVRIKRSNLESRSAVRSNEWNAVLP